MCFFVLVPEGDVHRKAILALVILPWIFTTTYPLNILSFVSSHPMLSISEMISVVFLLSYILDIISIFTI